MIRCPFSVLMPVYYRDVPESFAKAIDSILMQSLAPAQVVLVEDGPISDTLNSIISQRSEQHPGIIKRLALPYNGGMGMALNYGLQHCDQQYVARMDSDDIARPCRFSLQMDYLERHPEIDVLGANIEEFRTEPGDLSRVREVPQNHNDIVRFARRRNPINHMTVVFRRDKAIVSGGYWKYRDYEDYNLWYQMLKRGCQFYNLQHILVDVRVGNGMAKRRTGLKYFRSEALFFTNMYIDRFYKISLLSIALDLSLRFVLRMLPSVTIAAFYEHLLRRSSRKKDTFEIQ